MKQLFHVILARKKAMSSIISNKHFPEFKMPFLRTTFQSISSWNLRASKISFCRFLSEIVPNLLVNLCLSRVRI